MGRIGWLLRKIAMLAETLEPRAVDLAGRCQGALLVEALAGATRAPIVDRRVARPGVEGLQCAIAADPGHVGAAAKIHPPQGLAELAAATPTSHPPQPPTPPP